MTKPCVHGFYLYEDTDSVPSRTVGCCICHNLPEVMNGNPYGWLASKEDRLLLEHFMEDVNTLIRQRDAYRSETKRLKERIEELEGK